MRCMLELTHILLAEVGDAAVTVCLLLFQYDSNTVEMTARSLISSPFWCLPMMECTFSSQPILSTSYLHDRDKKTQELVCIQQETLLAFKRTYGKQGVPIILYEQY